MTETPFRRIGVIGFGEAGSIFAHDLAAAGIDVSVFDLVFNNEKLREAMLAKARDSNVRATKSVAEAIKGAELVISLVASSAAVGIAKQAAAFLRRDQVYMDANSVSPETKREISAAIAGSNADFAEAAVMGPIPPQRIKVPILLGGVRAGEIAGKLNAIGMDTTAASESIGVASAIKMCRSIVIKGLVSLVVESLFVARRYGAEDAVIASIEDTYPGMGWAKDLPDYLVQRAVIHSRRRAAEMREVAETVREAGIATHMSASAAELQDWLTEEMEANHYVPKKGPFSWREFADLIAERAKSTAKSR